MPPRFLFLFLFLFVGAFVATPSMAAAPQKSRDTKRQSSGPGVAAPAITEVTELRCTYWRPSQERIEITIDRGSDGQLALNSRVSPLEGKPSSKKAISNKAITPAQLAPVLEFVNASTTRNAFATEKLDEKFDGSLVQLTVEQSGFGIRLKSQNVFSAKPAVKDAGMRRAVEALFKLAELEFAADELF